MISDRKILEKQIIDLNKKVNYTKLSGVSNENVVINDVKVISKIIDTMPPKELKGLVDQLKKDIVGYF